MRRFFFSPLFPCLIASFIYFYNLSWGAPYFFHPDERNIAYSVNGLSFPTQLNPHFFAYGSLPIYSIYTLALLNHPKNPSVTFAEAVISSRIISAFLGILLVFTLFKIGELIKRKKLGIWLSFTILSSVGIIQYAHFGTFELWLTFFYLMLFYRFLFFLEKKSLLNLIYVTIFFALLLAIKLSAFLLTPILMLTGFIYWKQHKNWGSIFKVIIIFSLIPLGIFLSTNPYVLLDFTSFYNSVSYEATVAGGNLPVFYTGNFKDTIPVIYQLLSVYPFLINPFMTIVMLLGVISLIFKKNKSEILLATLLFFILYFATQVFLFVKWSRYLLPTLPFAYLLIMFFILDLCQKKKFKFLAGKESLILLALTLMNIPFAFSYLVTTHLQPDTRIKAFEWAKANIPKDKKIIIENYDLGNLPFGTYFNNLQEFNFYDLENNKENEVSLKKLIQNSDYLILPSQRLYKSRLTHSKAFPAGYKFYAKLSDSKLFKKIYATPCDLFCQILYLGDPIFRFEETTSVFDRPTVQIYQIKYVTK